MSPEPCCHKPLSKTGWQSFSCTNYQPPCPRRAPHGQAPLDSGDAAGVELLLCSCNGSAEQQELFNHGDLVAYLAHRAKETQVLVEGDKLTHLGFSP